MQRTATQIFYSAAALLRFDAPFTRCSGRLGRPTRPRRDRSAADQLDQAGKRFHAVGALGAMALSVYHQDSIAGETTAGKPHETAPYVLG